MSDRIEHPRTPVRVLRIITRLNIGGPSIQAITLSDRLTARGFETLLLHGQLGPGEGDMRYLLSPAVQTRQLPALRRAVSPVNDAAALAQIYRVLCRFRPAIVHTHMAKAGAIGRLATVAYNRTAGRSSPARLVHTYHGHVLEGYFSQWKTAAFIKAERRLARFTDRIVAISPQIRRELIDTYRIGHDEQYAVVPLGFDLNEFVSIGAEDRQRARETLGISTDALVVTTVGRLVPIKEHGLFIQAARGVLERHPRALFLIAGDGELRQDLEMQSRASDIQDRVRFLGWRRDLATIYAASDVFLLTSRNEGTPVALIESLAAAVPSVSTDVGGVRDVVDDEVTGLLARFGDVEALTRHVNTLLENPDRRRALGDRGRSTMIQRYHLDRLIDDVERLYRELL